VVIGVIAAIGYGARFSGDNATPPDLLFRWSTAIVTFVFDGIILLLLLLIARGLPLRETFALRRPPSDSLRQPARPRWYLPPWTGPRWAW